MEEKRETESAGTAWHDVLSTGGEDVAAHSSAQDGQGAVKRLLGRTSKGGFPSMGDLFAMLGMTFGAQVAVWTVAMLVLSLKGYGTDFGALEPALMGRTMAVIYVVSMSLALGGILLYRRARGARGVWVRFSRRGFNPTLLLWGFVLIFAAGVVLEPLLKLLPELSLNIGRGLWTILSLVVFAPVFEELICRGVVLGSLRARYGVTVAWLLSSLFFGILHVQPVQVINAFVVGLILGYVYLSTDSLWSVIILHAMNNALAYLMLITGHSNALLIDWVGNRTLYVVLYIAALALTVFSGYRMARLLGRGKKEENQPVG